MVTIKATRVPTGTKKKHSTKNQKSKTDIISYMNISSVQAIWNFSRIHGAASSLSKLHKYSLKLSSFTMRTRTGIGSEIKTISKHTPDRAAPTEPRYEVKSPSIRDVDSTLHTNMLRLGGKNETRAKNKRNIQNEAR